MCWGACLYEFVAARVLVRVVGCCCWYIAVGARIYMCAVGVLAVGICAGVMYARNLVAPSGR